MELQAAEIAWLEAIKNQPIQEEPVQERPLFEQPVSIPEPVKIKKPKKQELYETDSDEDAPIDVEELVRRREAQTKAFENNAPPPNFDPKKDLEDISWFVDWFCIWHVQLRCFN